MSVAVRAFGKLPAVGDFIRHRLDDDESRLLASWIERGNGLVEAIRRGGRPEDAPTATPRRYRFALELSPGKRLAAGILHESHDRGQLRRFPFALFTSLEGGAFRERPALIPVLLEDLWIELEERAARAREATDAEALFRILALPASTPVEPSRNDSERLNALWAATPADPLWERVGASEVATLRLVLFEVLKMAIAPHARTRGEDASVILRLPLGTGTGETAVHAAFWIELISGMLRLNRRAPSVFVEAGEKNKSATALRLFFRDPDERAYGCLMTPSHEAEYVDDLVDPSRVPSVPSTLGIGARQILEANGTRLADLLRVRGALA